MKLKPFRKAAFDLHIALVWQHRKCYWQSTQKIGNFVHCPPMAWYREDIAGSRRTHVCFHSLFCPSTGGLTAVMPGEDLCSA